MPNFANFHFQIPFLAKKALFLNNGRFMLGKVKEIQPEAQSFCIFTPAFFLGGGGGAGWGFFGQSGSVLLQPT